MGVRAFDLFRACKGLMREPEQIIFGGPMTGEAVSSLEEPVTKKVQGLLALPKEFRPAGTEEPCIRCGLCVDVCPESLIPETIVRAVRKENQVLAQEYEIDSCTECGACSYICPSKIPIVEVIRKGKSISPEPVAKPNPAYAFVSQG
jgi:electron transport complex protein RnfC